MRLDFGTVKRACLPYRYSAVPHSGNLSSNFAWSLSAQALDHVTYESYAAYVNRTASAFIGGPGPSNNVVRIAVLIVLVAASNDAKDPLL